MLEKHRCTALPIRLQCSGTQCASMLKSVISNWNLLYPKQRPFIKLFNIILPAWRGKRPLPLCQSLNSEAERESPWKPSLEIIKDTECGAWHFLLQSLEERRINLSYVLPVVCQTLC